MHICFPFLHQCYDLFSQLCCAVDWKERFPRPISSSYSSSRGIFYSFISNSFGNGHALHVLSWFYSRLQYSECLYSIPLRFPEKGIIHIELPILTMQLFFPQQIAEAENIEVDSKFRALVAVGSLVYLTLSTYTQWFYFSNLQFGFSF